MQSEMTRYEMTCPLNGVVCQDGYREDFKPNSAGIKKQCRWWTHIAGKDPQSEKILDHFDCAVSWLPVTMLEAAQMTRQSTATLQDFRNETHAKFDNFNKAIGQAAGAFNRLAAATEGVIEIQGGVPLPSLENKEHNGHEN